MFRAASFGGAGTLGNPQRKYGRIALGCVRMWEICM